MTKEKRFIKWLRKACERAQESPLTFSIITKDFAKRIMDEMDILGV